MGPSSAAEAAAHRRGRERLRTLKGFFLGPGASVAVETAIAISILVVAFAGLMAIVQESYGTDRLDRAARAVARAVALNEHADHCAAIRRELGLAQDFDCEAQWHISVDHRINPSDLSTVFAGNVGAGEPDGEMILVQIGWKRESGPAETDPEPELDTADGTIPSEGGDETPDPIDADASPRSVPMVAMGIARREPDAG